MLREHMVGAYCTSLYTTVFIMQVYHLNLRPTIHITTAPFLHYTSPPFELLRVSPQKSQKSKKEKKISVVWLPHHV